MYGRVESRQFYDGALFYKCIIFKSIVDSTHSTELKIGLRDCLNSWFHETLTWPSFCWKSMKWRVYQQIMLERISALWNACGAHTKYSRIFNLGSTLNVSSRTMMIFTLTTLKFIRSASNMNILLTQKDNHAWEFKAEVGKLRGNLQLASSSMKILD